MTSSFTEHRPMPLPEYSVIASLVEKKFIIELKSVESLSEIHLAQTLTYLKLGNYKLGLLINFNEVLLKNGIRRVVNNL